MGTLTRISTADESAEAYGAIWKSFEARHEEIRSLSTDQAYYGVSFATEEDGIFDYVAGMVVADVGVVPEGLVVREVPAARCAVLECPLQSIGDTYRYAFAEWLPGSPYEFDSSAPAYERYSPEGDEGSPVRIHIPIREKQVQAAS
jgi:predicted transcriptional regulator YdeE